MKYDLVIFIGRFQPLHNAHVEIIQRAFTYAPEVLVAVGSSFLPQTFKNPFTFLDRETIIYESVEVPKSCDLTVVPIVDTVYDNQAWAVRLQNIVEKEFTRGRPSKVAIIGHHKDESSFYLDMFPQWDVIEVSAIEPLNATSIRELYFDPIKVNLNFIKGVVPEYTLQYMTEFMETEEYRQIVREREFIDNYKKQFASLAYPPVFVTADAVVIQSGHVLLIKRRAEPGRGLWAFPGGFLNVNTDRSVQSAMLRELREETGIKVPEAVLVGNIKQSRVFDAINRSARGRTITHAFKIVLPDGKLPHIKGSDDAEKAKWVPISQVSSEMMFEDHYEILQFFFSDKL